MFFLIDLAELEQYFPSENISLVEDPFTFNISLSQDEKEDIFIINLKIKQKDTKEGHLIKFKLGLGKDRKNNSSAHDGHKPHFEIEIYKREENSFSANVYFTFDDCSDDVLMKYAKGTVVIISKIIKEFLKTHSLSLDILNALVFYDEVNAELSEYEPILLDALYQCYKDSNLIVRQDGQVFTIKTPLALTKYLNIIDLEPLYLPLFDRIKG